MAGVVRSRLLTEIVSQGIHPSPIESVLVFGFDEGQYGVPFEIAAGVTDAALPGVGAGNLDVAAITYLLVVAYGQLTVGFNTGDIFLNGTASAPARLEIGKTLSVTPPTLTNSSDEVVHGFYAVLGT